MSPDWQLVAFLVFATWFLTSLFWVLYGTHKADVMRQRYIAEQEILRRENTQMALMVKQTDMQRRVLGGTPISKLIGEER